MESRVLKACQWDVDTLTCAHFLEALLALGVVADHELILGLPKGSDAVKHLDTHLEFCQSNTATYLNDCTSIKAAFPRHVKMSDKTVR